MSINTILKVVFFSINNSKNIYLQVHMSSLDSRGCFGITYSKTASIYCANFDINHIATHPIPLFANSFVWVIDSVFK